MKKLISVITAIIMICCVPLTALAADFTPSVERKDAPGIVRMLNSAGAPCDAIITDASGNELFSLPSGSKLLIMTSVSNKSSAPSSVKKALSSASSQISKASDLSKLVPEIADALEELKKSSNSALISSLTVNDLAVKDLFCASILNDGNVENLPEGASLTVTLDTDFSDNDILFLIQNVSGTKWKLLNDYSFTSKGDLRLTLNNLGPIAVVVDGSIYGIPGDMPSPQTGEIGIDPLVAAATIFGVLAAAFAVAAYIKKRA